MSEWLGYAVKEESDADTAREEHEEPRGIIVLRFFIIMPEFDGRILGEINPNPKDDPSVHDGHVHPGESVGDPVSAS